MKFVPIPVVCLYFVTAGQVSEAENAENGAGSISKRFEERCAKFAESVFQVVPDPVLLPGAKPKRRDTCAINSQPTIVGGELASPREFPHMALIGFGDYPIKWRCGGSLINEQWVISVAHCTVTPDNLVAKYVLLGDLNVLSEEDERNHQSSPKIYRIIAHKHHPNYRRPSCYNDISLYKLNETVAFNEFVRPICLHAETSSENQTVLASGWGDTSHKGKQSEKLRKVGLNIVNHTDCSKAYPLTERDVRRQMKVGVNGTVQVCAWAQGKDTCQGDSGGPLQQALKTPYCMYTLIGLTSVGFKCATGAPGVYTRVNHYLPWIEKIAFTEKN
ncbi:serine protease [Nesidiocoris tenuis]|uniref:Serine protease n=1 Tax=Nesidiocoris tenuis TaxID=355587 RepID=A0ABN7B5Y2_9HEMI|nr:serine protease [Nesidiocoris tenuis]